jgi:tetratricopeptide (TPR) repeat protein
VTFLPRLLLIVTAALSAPCAAEESPDYVGRARCAACHMEQDARWTGSHHDLAMQEANETSVLGDFNNAIFDWFGVTSRFYRQDGRYMVRTEGPDETPQHYEIKYTYGVDPLQQYLIEFPGGRLQALDVAWDSRPLAAGGQRWLHLHPEDPVRPGDVLHWTGPNLNWNYMCADCHSTHLIKGYDPASGSYHTTWSEIDVSCEACHGAGANHARWAEQRARGEPADAPDMGLSVRLDERAGVAWTIDPATGLPSRSTARKSDREIQVCARCHSRRSQLTDRADAGTPFFDAYRPALLTEGLYYPDGQIQDEVYEWGSFLQSKMQHAGVTCADCHDPHSGALRLPGDLVCAQCHPTERYAVKTHHFHPEGSGTSCIGCHMPTTTYMRVDARHDHSMRVPRPDLSVTMGTPNACNRCHDDKTPQWAEQQVETWYGHAAHSWQRYAPALAAARAGLPGAAGLLSEIIGDADQPAIARATALQALGAYPSRETLGLLQSGIASRDPLERLGALTGLQNLGRQGSALAIAPLWDDLRAIRIEAARQLASFPQAQLPEAARKPLGAGIAEYVAAQTFNTERPEAQVNLGGLYADLKSPGEAEAAYREAIRLQPDFIPAYTNLAQVLSNAGHETEADGVLRSGLERHPQAAVLSHALGLSLVRQKRLDDALPKLAEAAAQDLDDPRYAYVYAVGLQTAGRLDQALGVLAQASERHPGNTDILVALATFNRDAGRREQALTYARKLQALLPGNPAVDVLVQELGP